MNEYRTCLIHYVNKNLCVILREGTNRVTLIFTREGRLDQGWEFMWSECVSDQTSTGWSIEVVIEERVGEQSASHKISKGGVKDLPLSNTKVVAATFFEGVISLPASRCGAC